MQELVSEKEHVKDLCYVRDLLKLKLNYWVSDRKDGKHTEEPEDIIETIENIELINQTLGYLYSKIKANEDRTYSRRIKTVAPIP